MFCGECGTQNPDTNQFCKNCGKPLRKPQQAPAAQPMGVPARPVAARPPVQPAYYPPQPAVVLPQGAVEGAPSKPPLNRGILGLAIIGVVLGIASWFRYPYLLGILAIVLGVIVVAKSEKKTSAVAIVATLGILTGLACIVVDLFYFTIFPIPPLDI